MTLYCSVCMYFSNLGVWYICKKNYVHMICFRSKKHVAVTTLFDVATSSTLPTRSHPHNCLIFTDV
jgi:hypothetical protein